MAFVVLLHRKIANEITRGKIMKKSVLVAMSGGTDSSAVCMMLLEQGYMVQGITMRMWDTPAKFSTPGQEQPDYILEARALAQKLGFPHHILDIRQDFQHCVIADFVNEYMEGRTPNPCVQCNIHIKTKYLLRLANELGCNYIATGHYANIGEENGVFYIEKGLDMNKDQSYFLWGLGQDVLSRMLFPLGNYTKDDARAEARRHGFNRIADKAESQDICFIDDNYRAFLHRQNPEVDMQIGEGNFLDINGRIVGRHKGYPYYTIGQRKGLVAMGEPMYVLKINVKTNEITIGPKDLLQVQEMRLRNCNFPAPELFSTEEVLYIRVRYKSRSVPGYVMEVKNNTCLICFVNPINAITPGQSAVIYRNQRMLGGGIIV